MQDKGNSGEYSLLESSYLSERNNWTKSQNPFGQTLQDLGNLTCLTDKINYQEISNINKSDLQGYGDAFQKKYSRRLKTQAYPEWQSENKENINLDQMSNSQDSFNTKKQLSNFYTTSKGNIYRQLNIPNEMQNSLSHGLNTVDEEFSKLTDFDITMTDLQNNQ